MREVAQCPRGHITPRSWPPHPLFLSRSLFYAWGGRVKHQGVSARTSATQALMRCIQRALSVASQKKAGASRPPPGAGAFPAVGAAARTAAGAANRAVWMARDRGIALPCSLLERIERRYDQLVGEAPA